MENVFAKNIFCQFELNPSLLNIFKKINQYQNQGKFADSQFGVSPLTGSSHSWPVLGELVHDVDEARRPPSCSDAFWPFVTMGVYHISLGSFEVQIEKQYLTNVFKSSILPLFTAAAHALWNHWYIVKEDWIKHEVFLLPCKNFSFDDDALSQNMRSQNTLHCWLFILMCLTNQNSFSP